jgi:hypothetical protein
VLSPINLGYVEIVFEVGEVAKRAQTTFAIAISRDNPLRRKLVKLRNAVRAYLAYQDLGHAFHATQDFFAHTNYVELQAGVPVGTPIPAGTVVPVPATFDEFSLDGFRRLLPQERPQIGGTTFDELESGAVLTRWLGEGDFCAGNFFNPAGGSIKVKLPIAVSLPGGGRNPDPPSGFRYCHYTTKSTVGLNKDEPTAKDPAKNELSYANHEVAVKAALQMSILLWRSFLASIGERCPQGGSNCPAPGEPTDVWGGSWELTVQGAQWTPGQSTACCLVLTRISEEQGRPLVGQPFGDRAFGPCPDYATFYTGTVAFGAGGDVLACTDSSGVNILNGVFKAIPAPLPQQYTPLQDGATLQLVKQTGAFIGTWTPQTFSLNVTGRCTTGKCVG